MRTHCGKPFTWALGLVVLLGHGAAWAQGQDSSPGDRYLLIMSELLPGIYDNANQHYFDRRRGLPEPDRHGRVETTITRVEAPQFGEHVFLWVNRSRRPDAADAPPAASYRLATLTAGPGAAQVTMRHYLRMQGEITAADLETIRPSDLRRTEGCDYLFERRAGHFHGAQLERACRFEWEGEDVYTDNVIELAPEGLWFVDHKIRLDTGERITGVASGEPYWLERARLFHCYADIPGVGGGRDEPFERYDGLEIHDKGGVAWFETRSAPARRIGIRLQSVTWHVLNERGGVFNRDSLVLYAMERLSDGTVVDHGYAFTEPEAQRIGNNLKWMLVNCSITPREQARPQM
jgi:hypothetical protein